MPQELGSPRIYRFGTFELNTAKFELSQNGVVLRLEKIPMELLILLVERRGELVSRQEILERLWGPNVFVDVENGINTAVRKIRIALSSSRDDSREPIQTIIGKGYRIALPVEVGPPAAPDAVTGPKGRPLPLMWVGMAGFILLAVILARVYLNKTTDRPISSIAVLPFDNFSGDPKEDYFADGITDAIITRVAQAGGFKVISRSSVMRFKGKNQDIRQIASELSVDAIVEGSVIRQGSRLRVTSQLIDARTDRHLWAEQYDRDSSEVLQLQDDIARRIASSVQASIAAPHEYQASPSERLDPAAYDNYLRARSLAQKRTPSSLAQAIDLYQRVLQVQPRYAEAYAGMADAYAALGYNSYVPPQESFVPAKAAAIKALDYDPRSAEAHAALGYTLFYYEWNIPAAQAEFDAALKANQSHAVTHHWRSVLLTSQGKYEEAEREISLARSLDPLSLPIVTDVGFELYYAARYNDAVRHLTNVVTITPDFAPAHLWLGRALEQKAMYPESVAELERADQLVHDWSVIIGALGHARALAGDTTGASRELKRLQTLSSTRFVTPYAFALLYVGLNDRQNTLLWLNRAYLERSHWLVWLPTDPRFASIRDTQEFQELIRKIRN